MNNVVKIKEFDPIVEKYIASEDKYAVKKTLAFEYFCSDIQALNAYIDLHVYDISQSPQFIDPKAQLEFTF
jgi:hypothetical protein